MKKKGKIHLRRYIIMLFLFCLLLDDVSDFILGLYAGFRGYEENYAQSALEENWVPRILTLVTFVLIGLFYDWQIKHKVTAPVERLANGMRKVSQGNLDVRIPVEGAFEFGQMEQTFNYMVEELAQAQRNRKRQEDRDKQLYTGIAHDLKTPMTMIMGYAKALEEQENLSKKDKKQFLNTIIEQTKQANGLLDTMLSYAKLQNENYTLKKEKKDIAECLRSCVADYYPAFEQSGIEPELLIPEKEVMYCFDELEIRRALTNLLSNIVKHNPDNISCLIQLEENVPTEENGNAIRIIAADSGPKISEELCDNLFEPFVVSDISRSARNGSGLGLSISKKIIERHGGKMDYVPDWKDGYKAFVIELYFSPGNYIVK